MIIVIVESRSSMEYAWIAATKSRCRKLHLREPISSPRYTRGGTYPPGPGRLAFPSLPSFVVSTSSLGLHYEPLTWYSPPLCFICAPSHIHYLRLVSISYLFVLCVSFNFGFIHTSVVQFIILDIYYIDSHGHTR